MRSCSARLSFKNKREDDRVQKKSFLSHVVTMALILAILNIVGKCYMDHLVSLPMDHP